jgi:hypothetical protein
MRGPHPMPTCPVCRQAIAPGCPSRCASYTLPMLVQAFTSYSASQEPWGSRVSSADVHAVLTALVDAAAGKPAPKVRWPKAAAKPRKAAPKPKAKAKAPVAS